MPQDLKNAVGSRALASIYNGMSSSSKRSIRDLSFDQLLNSLGISRRPKIQGDVQTQDSAHRQMEAERSSSCMQDEAVADVQQANAYDEPDPILTCGSVPKLRRSASGDSICSEYTQGLWDATDSYYSDVIKQAAWSGPECIDSAVDPKARLREASSLRTARPSGLGTASKKRKIAAVLPEDSIPSRNVRPKASQDPDDPFCCSKSAQKVSLASRSHDEPVVIAHPRGLRSFIQKRKLSVGVQWEIARLVSTGNIEYEDVTVEMLDRLKGNNVDAAPKVASVLFPDIVTEEPARFAAAFRRENEAKSPWVELDKEHEAFTESHTKALGRSSSDPWYGGKVHFIGKLKLKKAGKDKPMLAIELERPELGPSSRFTRRWGSAAFLRINVTLKSLHQAGVNRFDTEKKILEYFLRPFILNDNVFRLSYCKDHSVFLKMTNEVVRISKTGQFEVSPPAGDVDSPGGQTSLLKFLNWHNPLVLNSKQTTVKWAARFALGLSNSVPGVKLLQNNIHEIADEVSIAYDGKGKLPSEMDMTDGCGFANSLLLTRLCGLLDWDTFPTAIQCRIGGAKGMLLLHPNGKFDDADTQPHVFLRPSQTKINYSKTEPLDEAMLMVDVLRCSKITSPARLSAQTIINLAENGVPTESFIKLMQDGLDELVQGLTTFEGNNAMQALFAHVMRTGGVLGQRMSREFGGESRARGFFQVEAQDAPDIDDDETDEDGLQIDPALHQRSKAWWADQISGQPSSLEETVMSLLASGFHPHTCPVLAEKLEKVLNRAVNNYILRYKIDVPMSASGFVVPDPYGVLEPGEIYLKFSNSYMGTRFVGQDGLPTDIVHGEVLVTRHPCVLPSDVQKVRAVEYDELKHHTNVVIFSVKGRRSLASMLGGGDYDGDKVTVIWQPEIVNYFRNADPSFADPPEGIGDAFIKNTETVEEFLQRVPPDENPKKHMRELQTVLSIALRDQFIIGAYSKMHDYAVYTRGYFDEETKRLAYMFCTCLDASKTGLMVDPAVYAKDTQAYNRRQPRWSETPEEAERAEYDTSNQVNAKRPPNLHTFIMDTIRREGDAKGRLYMRRYMERVTERQSRTPDEHLTAKYLLAEENAEFLKNNRGYADKYNELQIIKQHVKDVRKTHRDEIGRPSPKGKKHGVRGLGFTDLHIETRQDTLRALSRRFASGPQGLINFDEEQVRRIRASYAYYHDYEEQKRSVKHWTRFPWDVAMRELCSMKAEALGFPKTITTDFYEKMNITQSARVHH